jgi:hypothetical protein
MLQIRYARRGLDCAGGGGAARSSPILSRLRSALKGLPGFGASEIFAGSQLGKVVRLSPLDRSENLVATNTFNLSPTVPRSCKAFKNQQSEYGVYWSYCSQRCE